MATFERTGRAVGILFFGFCGRPGDAEFVVHGVSRCFSDVVGRCSSCGGFWLACQIGGIGFACECGKRLETGEG